MVKTEVTGKRFSVVGCGRVGTNIARYLLAAGWKPVGLASRSIASARLAARIAGTGSGTVVTDKPWEATRKADVVFISTPDEEIEGVASNIAEHDGILPGTVVLHFCGALPSTILSPISRRGGRIGGLHPLQSVAGRELEYNPFEGAMMGIEGDPAAVEVAVMVAQALGGRPFFLETQGKVLYHAAAVTASNYLVTLVKAALDLICKAGVDRDEAFAILAPLIKGTLNNIERVGPAAALTGPIVRGDFHTIKMHLEEIREKFPDLSLLYVSLARYTVSLARQKGSLADEKAEKIIALLDEYS